MTNGLLRPRKGRLRAVFLPALVALGMALGCTQSPQAQLQEPQSIQPLQQSAPPPVQPKEQQPADDLRFLKTLPPKPAQTLPYPSLATPPIEDQAPVPLLTEAQRKKQEDDLSGLVKDHGKAKKAEKKKKPKQETAKAAKPAPLTN